MKTPCLRTWRWKELPVYNGFTHQERVRTWQLVSFMIDAGMMGKATTCCISGETRSVGYHSENYYDWHPYPLARGIHFALHRRFARPGAWGTIVERYAATGEEWFANLSPEPLNLAAQLRVEHGAGIADVFGRAFPPDGVPKAG